MTLTDESARPRKDVWMRGLIMLVFVVLFGVGQWLLNLLALVQFLWILFTEHPNPQLVRFGSSLAQWLGQVGRFQSCNTDDRPFPWAAWPAPA